ncbi:MAG: type II secretion system major pseudopilin GspG [Pirellula sp.]|nr:type II secretion system major pseudopilin GspG [Pirellula sp.]
MHCQRPPRIQCFRRTRIGRGAFTLVELMVTLVVLALLSGVVTLSVRSYLLRSKQNIASVEISRIVEALDTFYASYDRYPSNEEGLNILTEKSNEFPEGLLTFLPNDPWGNAYEYRSPGVTEPFDIICFGADKREGGSGGDRDITSGAIRARKR